MRLARGAAPTGGGWVSDSSARQLLTPRNLIHLKDIIQELLGQETPRRIQIMASPPDSITIENDIEPADSTRVPTRAPSVDVEQAKEEFAQLERQFTRHSTDGKEDLEKGDEDEDVFDLRDYLTSVNAANEEAGIISHHKRVGVTWDNLEVVVPGGADFKVCLVNLFWTGADRIVDLRPHVRTYVPSQLPFVSTHSFSEAVLNFCLGPYFFIMGYVTKFLQRNKPPPPGHTILHK